MIFPIYTYYEVTKQNIGYYLKIITVNDDSLIKALSEYENTMENGSDNVLTSINSLILSSYKGG